MFLTIYIHLLVFRTIYCCFQFSTMDIHVGVTMSVLYFHPCVPRFNCATSVPFLGGVESDKNSRDARRQNWKIWLNFWHLDFDLDASMLGLGCFGTSELVENYKKRTGGQAFCEKAEEHQSQKKSMGRMVYIFPYMDVCFYINFKQI